MLIAPGYMSNFLHPIIINSHTLYEAVIKFNISGSQNKLIFFESTIKLSHLVKLFFTSL